MKADIVIESVGKEINEKIVRENSRSIIRLAKRHARRQLSCLNIARYLPLGFVQINVFCADHRARRLAGFGLGKDLVGTIRLQRIRRIRSPDIFGSTIEIYGGLRFAWNRSWLDR